MTVLYLRAFIRCDSEDAAREVAEHLADALDIIASATLETVRPYWKMKGHQEVLLRLEPRMAVEEAYPRCLKHLGTGWKQQPNDLESIWNPGEGASFVEPSVIWAHLEAVPA